MKTSPQLIAAFVLLLGAAPLAHGQQTTTSKKAARRSAAAATTAPAVAGTAMATPPPPPAGAPAPGLPGGPRRPGQGPGPGPKGPGAGPRAGRVQQLSDFSGTLVAYTADNDEQVYDAFTLKTSQGTETVRFPRHLGQQLMAAAKPGSTLTISGFRDTDPQGRTALHLVSVAAGGQTIQNTPPTPPTTPPTPQTTTVRGTIGTLRQGPDGRTNALVMSDATVLRLPPAAATQLADKLKAGATVEATGTVRPVRSGEVAAKTVRVVQAETLTLDGVKFLVQ